MKQPAGSLRKRNLEHQIKIRSHSKQNGNEQATNPAEYSKTSLPKVYSERKITSRVSDTS